MAAGDAGAGGVKDATAKARKANDKAQTHSLKVEGFKGYRGTFRCGEVFWVSRVTADNQYFWDLVFYLDFSITRNLSLELSG